MGLIDEIIRLIQRIQDTWQRFVDLVNRVLSLVPAYLRWVLDRVNELWNQVVQMWNDFWAEVGKFFSRFGDPVAVGNASESWTMDVATPIGQVAPTVKPSQLSSSTEDWSGDTAEKYEGRAGDQQDILVAVAGTLAKTVSGALDSLKIAMLVLYGAIVGIFSALIGAIITGLGSSATIVGIPAGIVIIIGGGVVAIGALLAAFALYSGHVDAQANVMKNAIANPSVTRWPEFVV